MAVQVQLRGAAALRRAAADLRMEDVELPKRLRKAISTAMDRVPKAVRAEVPQVMPSGYSPTLLRSLKFRKSIRLVGKGSGVSLTVTAAGRREQRDLPAMNRGVLRHPLFGNRKKWYAQRVRAGMVDRPWQREQPQVIDAVQRELDLLVGRVERG